jgi:hypothetical protein
MFNSYFWYERDIHAHFLVLLFKTMYTTLIEERVEQAWAKFRPIKRRDDDNNNVSFYKVIPAYEYHFYTVTPRYVYWSS